MGVASNNEELAIALRALQRDGILIGARRIADGDEAYLTADEAAAYENAVAKVRRQSGAARALARELLGTLGFAVSSIPRSPAGAPHWPVGSIGSIAHDRDFAVAAVARADVFRGVGIDIEPDEPLRANVFEMIATPSERQRIGRERRSPRLLFCAKEAVYKAVHPATGAELDFQDVETDFVRGAAVTKDGDILRLRWIEAPRLVVVALFP